MSYFGLDRIRHFMFIPKFTIPNLRFKSVILRFEEALHWLSEAEGVKLTGR